MSDNYYYKDIKYPANRNVRYYYNAATNKRIAKKNIPEEFIPNIKSFSQRTDNKSIDEKIESLKNSKKIHEEAIKKLEEEIKKLEEEKLNEEKKSEEKKSEEKKPEVKKELPKNILEKYKITTKKEWKTWLKYNHSDKNPNVDNDILVAIINEGRARGW